MRANNGARKTLTKSNLTSIHLKIIYTQNQHLALNNPQWVDMP